MSGGALNKAHSLNNALVRIFSPKHLPARTPAPRTISLMTW